MLNAVGYDEFLNECVPILAIAFHYRFSMGKWPKMYLESSINLVLKNDFYGWASKITLPKSYRKSVESHYKFIWHAYPINKNLWNIVKPHNSMGLLYVPYSVPHACEYMDNHLICSHALTVNVYFS